MNWIQNARCLRGKEKKMIMRRAREEKLSLVNRRQKILLRCMNDEANACYILAFAWLVASWSVDQTNRAFSYYFLS